MIDEPTYQFVGAITGAAIGWAGCAAAVRGVLTGKLLPRATLEIYRQALEEQKQATAWYRAAYEQERDRADRILEPSAAVAVQVLRSIPTTSGSEIPGGT